MGRDRVVRLIAIAVCVVVFAAVAARYLWLRRERQHTEQTVATLVRKVAAASALLSELRTTRAVVDSDMEIVRANHERLRARATALHADLEQTRANTTTAAIGAYLTAAQANDLGTCLTGVSQALNQLSVGDRDALASLQAVEKPCRAAGVP